MKKYLPLVIVLIGLMLSNPSIDSLMEKIENITIVHKNGKRIIISDSNNKSNGTLMNYNKINNFIFFRLVFADVAESPNFLMSLTPPTTKHVYFGFLTVWIRIY